MFKNKALYVQMVNPQTHQPSVYQPQLPAASHEDPVEIPAWIDQAIDDKIMEVAKVALVLMAANAALVTVSKILINNLSPH